MACVAPAIITNERDWSLPAEYTEPHWYAAYTCANREKRVALQMNEHQVEHFLPTYETLRRWKDRRVRLEMPLFPGYVFVFLALRDRLQVLRLPGVVQLVSVNGHPAALADGQVERLRNALVQLCAEPHPYLTVGRRVRIIAGPLRDAEGILLRRKSRCRVILSMDLILRSVAVEVDIADLEILPNQN